MTNSVTIEKPFHSDTNGTVSANIKHKDVLFRIIFSDKKNLLELYNTVNDTNYRDIYSSVLQQIPLPQYIVFYNGTQKMRNAKPCIYRMLFQNIPTRFPVCPVKQLC